MILWVPRWFSADGRLESEQIADQLTDLADSLGRARNLNVAVREWGDEIVFLHKILVSVS
jgi:3',5'-cyclic AMP phosphodiesterase CpdA